MVPKASMIILSIVLVISVGRLLVPSEASGTENHEDDDAWDMCGPGVSGVLNYGGLDGEQQSCRKRQQGTGGVCWGNYG
ncbi:hypothetical protein I3760_01G104600 [Carya illinoinensis]|nr:hypothetical protein I3760_01G104600 [Carya illinoinensis]